MNRGQFAIFDGQVGIIAGIDVPIDEDGKPVRSNATVVSSGVEQENTSQKEAKYLAVEFHPITESGSTRMRVIEKNGEVQGVETDIMFLVGDATNLLEVIKPTDERIPESRRLKSED